MAHVLFPYIAQPHQEFHSLSIALEMSRLYPDIQVHIASLTRERDARIRTLSRLYPQSSIRFDILHQPPWIRHHIEQYGPTPLSKLAVLFLNRNYFSRFQAIVVPERTSLYLRKMGVTRPRLIWTRHGAGDRAIGFARDVRQFDYVLLAGPKVEDRLLKIGSLRTGHYATGIYAKFDMVRRLRPDRARLFTNNRPTIIYNPHFCPTLSSWPRFGMRVLEYFASQTKYNLIFAPHYRLFDTNRRKIMELLAPFTSTPHMIIDPGSDRSVDMTYTLAADLYMGDVSSQIGEFLIRPRPCLFLDAHQTRWRGNADYENWTLGPVEENVDALEAKLDSSFRSHANFLDRQKEYIRNTFGFAAPVDTAAKGAKSIVDFLRVIG
ncbi:CDP-glycerol glycerophosphotransferase family protein [Komagataeibacter sp. FNDCR2]|uniref:CDP-glycerol glycerophosphotransferase family protein n=1 Tax=Komagataeibacter sp. FNDCR2 TaxID=2878682 RepID=UPI001E532866|nr:CDP-glycerol glycerophosphotransferase family protein [Komagataeibacter sp. FNDCR2]MCE2573987.1 CDP-glycerol glycerophosphotransferase family protein [Komagataeibacter sp. FNDCR2]